MRENFEKAVHLLPTNQAVDSKNNDFLTKTRNPVARIVSSNQPDIASAAREDQSIGIPAVLNLSVGCRVMLRVNLWVEGGLVNGSLGTVRKIIFAEGDLPPSLPLYVLVEFDRYSGPELMGNLFPIVPISRNWLYNSTQCTG